MFVDAPCTGTGTFRRRPDVLWRFSNARLEETVLFQSRILESAAGLARPGGAVVYGTCSVEPEENSLLVGGFLSARREFRMLGELLVMPSADHDGAYCALIAKEG